jgi:hypothetical protein
MAVSRVIADSTSILVRNVREQALRTRIDPPGSQAVTPLAGQIERGIG